MQLVFFYQPAITFVSINFDPVDFQNQFYSLGVIAEYLK